MKFTISSRRENNLVLPENARKNLPHPRSSIMMAGLCLLLLLCLAPLLPAQSQEGGGVFASAARLFRQGRFQESAAAYRAILEGDPSSAQTRTQARAHAGLVQSLLKLDDVKAAGESSARALSALPQSSPVHAAHGDVLFREGRMAEAESEYRTALKLNQKCARAWLGLGRIEAAVARRAHAREAFAKAHELDPEDGDALYRWAVLLPYPQNVAELERHLAGYRSDAERERREREYIDFVKALAGRKIWQPAGETARAEIKLDNIATASAVRGMGVRVKLNGGPAHTLLLDTGASWITVPRKVAERAAARKLSDFGMEGTGDNGPSAGYYAWVDRITIGDLEFHDCVIQVMLKDSPGPEEGTIGLQMLTDYLITLDFPAHRLRLAHLPDAAALMDDFDAPLVSRPAPDAHTVQFFSFGHLLLMPTRVNDKAEGLFILDTGANTDSITTRLGRQVSRLRSSKMRVSGNSGDVSDVYFVEDVRLQFAHTPQPREDIPAYERPELSKNLETEISGFIGFPTLTHRKVTINFRDGVLEIE